MSTPAEHAAWVERVARSQDREAFTRLFQYFAPRLNGYLLRMGSSPDVAQEVTQDALTTLWRKAALFDPAKSSVSTWLFRIARNRRIDLARRDKSDRLDANEPLLVPQDEAALETQLEGQQRDEAMRSAMETLPTEQRELVHMAFFQELSHAQIAEQTGLPLGTVKSRIRLAFGRLRRALEAEGVVEAG